MSDPEVLFDTLEARAGRIGVATLNRPDALNSLNLEMIDALYARFQEWRADPDIVLVILRGAGDRAFCAGGDVRRLYETIIESDYGPNPYAVEFFTHEYRLDYLIHTFPRPVLCFGDGIVMGGGMGLMTGASHRVVTERTRMAMPEITIGLYPDVGGTWFLNRMPPGAGLFLGLTGASINAGDALYTGLADAFLESGRWSGLVNCLLAENWQGDESADRERLDEILSSVAADTGNCPRANLESHANTVARVTAPDSLRGVVKRILAAGRDGDRWLERAAAGLEAGSPTTAHLVYEQLRRGGTLSLAEVFRMELVMSVQCTRHPDFAEGVRALLVDKDNRPQWKYGRVADVPRDWVEAHFRSPWNEGEHPLADLGSDY